MKLFFVAIALVVLSACALQTGTISRAPAAWISLIGPQQSVDASVDDRPSQHFTESKRILAVEPGKHRLRVWSNGNPILDQLLIVADQQTLEISLP